MDFPQRPIRALPNPPRWTKALGVGVVIMGLAMGTGELVLWPHLVVKHGLGLLWLALLGLLAQVVINHEVARAEVATGESFFTQSARVLKYSPLFWLPAALVLYVWPGWASALGTILQTLFGVGSSIMWAWVALALVLLLTFSGRVAYKLLEGALKIIVPLFFLLLIVISFYNISGSVLKEALLGLWPSGLPAEVNMNTLLGAIVFAGAGGMLNLCVSLWYRDKDFGMGAYAVNITNPITGKPQAVDPVGAQVEVHSSTELMKWKGWMRFVKVDQGIIFGLLGFITLFLLAVNAYAVLKPQGIIPEGTSVAVAQASIFAEQWGSVGFYLYLVMAFLMLFSVMWTVVDAVSRIVSDILATGSKYGPLSGLLARLEKVGVHKLYYSTVTVVVLVGAVLLPLRQPLPWLVTAGVLGGLSMFLYTPFLLYINNRHLPKALRPSWGINVLMVLITVFYGYFTYRILLGYLA